MTSESPVLFQPVGKDLVIVGGETIGDENTVEGFAQHLEHNFVTAPGVSRSHFI